MTRHVKIHLFFDRRQLMFVAITVLFVLATVVSAEEPVEGALWLLWAVLAVFFSAGTILYPCLYIMTPKGITICYLLGCLRRFIPWDTVRRLDVRYGKGYKRLPYFGDTFFIDGKAQGKSFFFTENEIVRTRRARKLLERYTGMPVEGFILQDIRDWRKRRKEKKERMRRHKERQARVERNRKAKEAAKKQKREGRNPPSKKGK